MQPGQKWGQPASTKPRPNEVVGGVRVNTPAQAKPATQDVAPAEAPSTSGRTAWEQAFVAGVIADATSAPDDWRRIWIVAGVTTVAFAAGIALMQLPQPINTIGALITVAGTLGLGVLYVLLRARGARRRYRIVQTPAAPTLPADGEQARPVEAGPDVLK